MATTTAAITLTSTDIMDSPLSISNTSTLYTAGTNTGLVETTGLARKKFASSGNIILLDAGLAGGVAQDVTEDGANKVFIRNINARGDGSKYVNILLAAVEIGRLYGGDWMLIPWSAADGKDIEFTAYDATETTLEYMVFYQ
tara:strand:+ start:420 stop:845 length:426 start_codon:yes stop_codon:yes gene_type:complete